MRGRDVLAICLLGLAAAYAGSFYGLTRFNPEAAWSRFELLNAVGYEKRAVDHGDQALDLWAAEGVEESFLHPRRLALADAHFRGGERVQALRHYRTSLQSAEASALNEQRRVEIRRRMATMFLLEGQAQPAAIIAASFLERAGDAAVRNAHGHDHDDHDSGANPYPQDAPDFITMVDEMREGFTDVLPADGMTARYDGDKDQLLQSADAMTDLGGYYAQQESGDYAAAGLLAAAYSIRMAQLGPDHADTVQVALLLAPVYERIDRVSDAEKVYEEVFRAQERVRGANNPELSLYIRLLAGNYEKQNRLTEAEALNRHMRQLFRDAYGARRYAANRSRDRLFDVDRPVSMTFRLDGDYIPPDLVRAEIYDIPLSKPPGAEEMQMREAKIDGTSMPEALGALFDACAQDGERLSLRSAYRSHGTQTVLHEINRARGTVAHPGTSEHQLGLAADVDVNRRFMRGTDRSYACFEKKAWQYGFILSFPVGNTYLPGEDTFEPWHWRFVGPQTALLYREIGPWGRPQEFLAALPCYEERALSGLFVDREQGDVCLQALDETNGTRDS
ncbi:MAG: D-alanyl-D-alanine carboxypeptidase family protein [Pseudomonadota bacterium]